MRGEFLEVVQDRLPGDAVQLHDEAVPHAARQGVRHGGALLRQAGDRLQDVVRGGVQHHVLAGKALAQSLSRSKQIHPVWFIGATADILIASQLETHKQAFGHHLL